MWPLNFTTEFFRVRQTSHNSVRFSFFSRKFMWWLFFFCVRHKLSKIWKMMAQRIKKKEIFDLFMVDVVDRWWANVSVCCLLFTLNKPFEMLIFMRFFFPSSCQLQIKPYRIEIFFEIRFRNIWIYGTNYQHNLNWIFSNYCLFKCDYFCFQQKKNDFSRNKKKATILAIMRYARSLTYFNLSGLIFYLSVFEIQHYQFFWLRHNELLTDFARKTNFKRILWFLAISTLFFFNAYMARAIFFVIADSSVYNKWTKFIDKNIINKHHNLIRVSKKKQLHNNTREKCACFMMDAHSFYAFTYLCRCNICQWLIFMGQ